MEDPNVPTWTLTRPGPGRAQTESVDCLFHSIADPSLRSRLINEKNDDRCPVSREPVPLMASATVRIV